MPLHLVSLWMAGFLGQELLLSFSGILFWQRLESCWLISTDALLLIGKQPEGTGCLGRKEAQLLTCNSGPTAQTAHGLSFFLYTVFIWIHVKWIKSRDFLSVKNGEIIANNRQFHNLGRSETIMGIQHLFSLQEVDKDFSYIHQTLVCERQPKRSLILLHIYILYCSWFTIHFLCIQYIHT